MSSEIIHLNLLEKMAEDEEIMRRSEWYINECNIRKDIPNGWIHATEEGQRMIVNKYFNDDFMKEIALRQLRSAHRLYPENQIFRNRLQVRFNRARKGELKAGDSVPEFMFPLLKDSVNMFVGSSMT